jgi:MFS family permease
LITAAGCTIGMMVSVVPFHIGTFPLFLGPVSAEFGWGRAGFAMSVGLSGLCAALSAPFVGRLVDRFGARPVLLPAIVIYAIATAAQSLLTASKPQFYATYCLLGVSEAIAGPVAFSHLISSTFRMRRGLFLALVIGAAPTVSIMIMAPITHLLIDHYGWRTTYQILGAIILLLGFPAMVVIQRDPLRTTRAHTPAGHQGAVVEIPGRTVRQVFAAATFWITLVALVVHSLVVGGVRAHFVALLTDRGISTGIATFALATFALAGLIGNVCSGILLDRVPRASGVAVLRRRITRAVGAGSRRRRCYGARGNRDPWFRHRCGIRDRTLSLFTIFRDALVRHDLRLPCVASCNLLGPRALSARAFF